MQQRFIVAADRETIGVAVRVPGGYRFFCSDPRFQSADSRLFRRAHALVSHVTELAKRLRVDRKARDKKPR